MATLTLFTSWTPAALQQRDEGRAQYAAELSLQATSAFPGGPLTVPLELKRAGTGEVTAIELRVVVPEGTTFKAAEPAYALEELNGSVKAVLAAGGNAINVSVQAGGKPLPDGVLGYLVFLVPSDADLGDREMQASDGAVKGPAAQPIEPVKVTPATVSIVDPKSVPIIACFFYMH